MEHVHTLCSERHSYNTGVFDYLYLSLVQDSDVDNLVGFILIWFFISLLGVLIVGWLVFMIVLSGRSEDTPDDEEKMLADGDDGNGHMDEKEEHHTWFESTLPSPRAATHPLLLQNTHGRVSLLDSAHWRALVTTVWPTYELPGLAVNTMRSCLPIACPSL